MEIAEGLVVPRLLVEWPYRLEHVGTPIHGTWCQGKYSEGELCQAVRE